ncbi:hypothetical protein BGZ70_002889 [Mortierella alpina]|uniref:Major facilitator superfamily (MFS) profile domain-containing protein n=1 Tax=Mortierella alpina TaxID=64518 RepID=A0A9P6ITE9_MORAP|nr:hypothetical protein BGZ70_002889 [Mortierella alpina]
MESSTIKPLLPWYRRLDQNKGFLLALVSMAQMLDIINVASVTITLPEIMRQVGFRVDQLQWVTSAYALAYGAFLLIGGRFGDLFGHRRIYIIGVTWFAIWAVVNGFAKDPIVMSVGRALQGMGAGLTIPPALAILTTTYPVGPERTKALAIFGGVGGAGSVVGVLLGGILGSTIGWRWIFYITAIIAFIMAGLGFVVIPASLDTSKAEDRRIDYFGIISFMLGIVAIIYYLSESPAVGWGAAQTLAPLLVGLALLVAFVVNEYKIDYPIMPFHIWRSRRLVASCVTIICCTASLNALIFYSSLAFQNVLKYTALKTSLAYIVHGVGLVVSVVVLTKLVTMVRTKIIIIVGWFFIIASGVLWAQLKADSSYWSIPFPALILNFLGMTPIWLCCQIISVADADDEDQGVVGAVYNVSLQIGTPIGVAVSNVIANSRNSATAAGADLLRGYNAAFYSVAVLGGLGLIATVFLAPNSDPAAMSQAREGTKAGEDAELGSDSIGHPGKVETARNSEDKSTIEVSPSVSLDKEKRNQQ